MKINRLVAKLMLLSSLFMPAFGFAASVSPNPASPGQTITISGTLTLGQNCSGCTVYLWLATTPGGGALQQATINGVNFTANQPTSIQASMALSSTLAVGTYYIASGIYNASGSQQYIGNYASFAVQTQVAPTVTPNPANPGQGITISGTLTLGQNCSGCTVYLWLSTTPGGGALQQATINGVNFTANQPTSIQASMTLSSTLVAGTYYIASGIYNASGSQQYIGDYVSFAVQTGTGTAPTVTPNPANPGQTITISGTLTLGQSCSGCTVYLWLATTPGGGALQQASINGVNFTANQPASIQATMALSSTLAAGTYYVAAGIYSGGNSLQYIGNYVSFAVHGSSPSGQVKWHPGHYMSSGEYTTLGNRASNCGGANCAQALKAAEIAVVRAGPAAVLGWEGYYTPRALNNDGPGVIDGSSTGSGLDADYVAVTGYQSGTAGTSNPPVYNSPRRMGIYVFDEDYFAGNTTSFPNPSLNAARDWVLTNSTYGSGPPGSASPDLYGWWTSTGTACQSCGAMEARWRPSVNGAYISLFRALAAHVLPDGYTIDTSPYIEWVKLVGEFVDVPSQYPTGGINDSTYSDAAALAQMQSLYSAGVAAFPHTNVVATMNFLGNASAAPAVTFAQGEPGMQTAFGGPDIFGASSGQNVPTGGGLTGMTWGQALYTGLLPPASGNPYLENWVTGGTVYIGKVPYMGTIQNTELVAEYGHYYTPADLYTQANTYLHATHVAWQYVEGMPLTGYNSEDATANWFGTASGQSTWNQNTSGGVLAEIVQSPLSTTACPSAYKSGCNTH